MSAPHTHVGVTHEDIMARLEKGEARFDAIEAQLASIAESLKALPEMQQDIAETKELVEAWSAVKVLGKAVKWTAGVMVALGAIFATVKLAVLHLIGRVA